MQRLSVKVFLLVAALVVPALAVVPQFWEVRTYEQLNEGDLDGLSITGDGDLVLAPVFDELYDTGEPLVFSAVADTSGNIYLGTGHEGRVFRVDDQGAGTLIADFDELDVLALAIDPDGTLLAATSPDGRVYRIPQNGEPEVFFDPEDLYIWDMQFDASGRLLVATGEDGIVYRVDADGEGEIFYDSDNTHILTMVIDDQGRVIAGGSPRGYVYRIEDSGQAFVLYDSGLPEVRSIALAPGGEIYAAVLDGSEGGATSSGGPNGGGALAATSTITIGTGVQAASTPAQNGVVTDAGTNGPGIGAGSGVGPGSGAARSRLLEILPDGAVTTVWESASELVFAVLYRDDVLYFSSGAMGRIYALGSSRRPTLLVESTEEQTTRLLLASGRLLAASSNRGKLWELTDGERSQGVYESMVRDTGAVSTWGKLTAIGDGVRVATRSGNTASPDATWSAWVSPGPAGDITSPPARFVQWQAVLDASEAEMPRLSSVTLPYLQQNFRPEISSVQILQTGLALREQQANANPTAVEQSGISGGVVPLVPRPSSRTLVEDGAQALRWTASDQNGDVLTFSMFYRAENEVDWKVLANGLPDTFYTIEPDTLPDGMYLIRLVASDIGSNPAATALTGEFITRPFAIDNTPPVVTMATTGAITREVTLEAVATDQTSTLKQAEMSVDAGSWVPLFPVDGIVDSVREEFRFGSGPLAPGEHVVSFRIYDQNENVGIAKTIVQIPD